MGNNWRIWRVLCMFLYACMMLMPASGVCLRLEAPLPDAAEEARARQLFMQVRCVVCAGETIADSPADIAYMLRHAIREQVANGAHDDKILEALAAQYGDEILMTPRLTPKTWALWFGPLLLLLLSGLLAFYYFSHARKQTRRAAQDT